jgi:hypothetical protein
MGRSAVEALPKARGARRGWSHALPPTCRAAGASAVESLLCLPLSPVSPVSPVSRNNPHPALLEYAA